MSRSACFLVMSQGHLQLDLHYIAECQCFKSRVVMHLGDELLTLLCFITVLYNHDHL